LEKSTSFEVPAPSTLYTYNDKENEKKEKENDKNVEKELKKERIKNRQNGTEIKKEQHTCTSFKTSCV
jgi:hypothetical protein